MVDCTTQAPKEKKLNIVNDLIQFEWSCKFTYFNTQCKNEVNISGLSSTGHLSYLEAVLAETNPYQSLEKSIESASASIPLGYKICPAVLNNKNLDILWDS
jgi:hypothetical protein